MKTGDGSLSCSLPCLLKFGKRIGGNMILIKCRNCNQKIPIKSKNCPFCGDTNKLATKTKIGLLIGAVTLFYCFCYTYVFVIFDLNISMRMFDKVVFISIFILLSFFGVILSLLSFKQNKSIIEKIAILLNVFSFLFSVISMICFV